MLAEDPFCLMNGNGQLDRQSTPINEMSQNIAHIHNGEAPNSEEKIGGSQFSSDLSTLNKQNILLNGDHLKNAQLQNGTHLVNKDDIPTNISSSDASGENIPELKKKSRYLSRKDLEEFFVSMTMKVLTYNSSLAELQHICAVRKQQVEKWKNMCSSVTKQNEDLSKVLKKFLSEHNVKPNDLLGPVKITRSVGLQVSTQTKRGNLLNGMTKTSLKTTKEAPQYPSINNQKKEIQKSLPLVSKAAENNNVVQVSIAATNVNATDKTIANSTVSNICVVDLSDDDDVCIDQSVNRASKRPASTENASFPKRGCAAGQAFQPHWIGTNSITQVVTPNNVAPLPPLISCAPRQHLFPNLVISKKASIPVTAPSLGPITNQRLAFPKNDSSNVFNGIRVGPACLAVQVHPAPLPIPIHPQPFDPSWKKGPSRPTVKINRVNPGLILSWNMEYKEVIHAKIMKYQLFAYHENAEVVPSTDMWKSVGDMKSLPLPMACTLTQFIKGNAYHFAVRAVDIHGRIGTFSEPASIVLPN